MDKNIFRINDFSLLRSYNTTLTRKYSLIKLGGNINQYVEKGISEDERNRILDYTVWYSGQYKNRLNKVYNSNQLISIPEENYNKEFTVKQFDVMIRQGYSFENVFGLLVIIIDVNNNIIYNSQILTADDFKITSDKELIDGSFWLLSKTIYIPQVNDILSVQIVEVTYNDIEMENDNIGFIYNYPKDFIPLITEKPIPDYILTSLSLDNNFYLNVKLYTTENKTIEKSILDYFNLSIADIEVSHLINYGNENDGYKTIRVSNEDDKYLPIKIGLDLSDWSESGNATQSTIDIHVTTEILVNGKLMQREAILHTDILEVINPLIADKITHPETNFPVEIKNEQVIEHKTINTPKQIRVVTVPQPVFIEMISDTFKIENKNISFKNLTVPAYLIIAPQTDDEQLIESKITIDNVIYFDISDFKPVEKECEYQLLNKSNLMIIGKGIVKV